MDKLLQRERSNRKTAIIHGVPSSTTNAIQTPTTLLPRPSLKGLQTHYVSLLSELLAHETALLARLLNATKFSGRNASDLSSLIASLPPHLKSGSRLLDRLPKGVTNLPDAALLCAAHKPLNGRVVRSILNIIKEEVGWKMSTVVAFGGSELTNYLRRTINVAREIHALWMDQSTFSQNLRATAEDAKWVFELSRCEACILSRIGADADTLKALRTIVLSRKQTRDLRRRPPCLLGWVEAWIDTGIDSGNDRVEIRYLSGESAKDLKAVRKLAHVRRREAEGRKAARGRRRHRHAPSSSRQQIKEDRDEGVGGGALTARRSAPKVDDRETDPDPENAIIDFYDNPGSHESPTTLSLSRLYLSSKPEDTGMTHPAFRDSQSIEVADADGAYGEGAYAPVRKDGAERRAEEYRSLLEDGGDDGDYTDASVYSQDETSGDEAVGLEGSTLVDAQRPGTSTSDVSRVTRWEDMYGR